MVSFFSLCIQLNIGNQVYIGYYLELVGSIWDQNFDSDLC